MQGQDGAYSWNHEKSFHGQDIECRVNEFFVVSMYANDSCRGLDLAFNCRWSRLTSDEEGNSNQNDDDVTPVPDVDRVKYGVGIEEFANLGVGKSHEPHVK